MMLSLKRTKFEMVFGRFRNDRNSTFWVTFISVPGEVGSKWNNSSIFSLFLEMQWVLYSLLKYYYHCTTEWTWLLFMDIERRLGTYSYKTAATIFLISRTIGSAFRLYLVVIVLQRFVFDFTESHSQSLY
jgi:hypothetical protein